MSATGFLVLLIVSIAILMVLIMKVKLHPTFALFISALFMGLVLGRFEAEGFGFTDILTTITGGFGGTLGSMGIPIMLGAILAMGVQDTGAAKAIANSFIKLFRGKNLELAPALTAYIVSIPVFGDITTILTSNIANVLSKRKHISMGKMAAFTQTGLNLLFHGISLGYMWAIVFYPLEMLIAAIEAKVYCGFITEKSKKMSILCAVVANLLSMLCGGYIISHLPI